MQSKKNTKQKNTHPQQQQKQTKSITINSYRYTEQDRIGQGFQSCVYKAFHVSKKYEVALKIIRLDQIHEKIHKELLNDQLYCLQMLKGIPYIVNLIDVVKTPECIYVVTQLCFGDLSVRNNKKMEQREAWGFIKQIIKGYKEVYLKDIVHRDIKPQNMFKKDESRVKLGDFGFATTLALAKKQNQYNIGSPSYMAPEVLRRNDYSHSSDIWSIGISYFQLVTGKTPWEGVNQEDILAQINLQTIRRKIDQSQFSKESKVLLKKLLAYEANNRISPEQLFEYQLFEPVARISLPTKLRSFDKISISTASTPKVQSTRSFDSIFETLNDQNFSNAHIKLPTDRYHRYLSYQNLPKISPQKIISSQKQLNEPQKQETSAFKKKYRASFDISQKNTTQIQNQIDTVSQNSIQKTIQGHLQLINIVFNFLNEIEESAVKINDGLISEFHVFKTCLRNYVASTIESLLNLQNSNIFQNTIPKIQLHNFMLGNSYKQLSKILHCTKQRVQQNNQLKKHWHRSKQQKPRAISNAGIAIIKIIQSHKNNINFVLDKKMKQIIDRVCDIIQIFAYLNKNNCFTGENVLGMVKFGKNVEVQELENRMEAAVRNK